MKRINNIIILLSITFSSLFSFGQKLNNSPYTRYGLGEITEQTSASYFGMNSTAVSLAEFNHLNISNPASYGSFIKHKPVFDIGLYGKIQTLKTDNSTSNQSNFALRSFALGMPIGDKTGIAFGLLPYSTVGYDINAYAALEGDSVRYNYDGNGGINKVFLGFGRKIINRGDSITLSVGVNAAYLFGTIENSRSVIYTDPTYYNTKVNDFKTLKGANFDFGIHYSQKINAKIKLQVGADYVLSNKLDITKDFYAYNFKYSTYSVIETAKDTIEINENQNGKVTLPSGIKVGAALTFNQKLTVSLQYKQTNWNNYDEVYNGTDLTPAELNQSNKIAVGISYTPTAMKDWNSKTRSIFQKSTYRAGLKAVNTNITVNNTLIKDYGISFGISTPLLSSRSFSSVDFGVDFGKLGTTKNSLIEDNYFRLYLGFSLSPSNYDSWFRKRKYD